jgi:hypothetical protein
MLLCSATPLRCTLGLACITVHVIYCSYILYMVYYFYTTVHHTYNTRLLKVSYEAVNYIH